MLGAEQLTETILDILEEERWTVPTLRTKMRIIYCEGEAGRLPAGDTRSSSGQSHVDGPDRRVVLRVSGVKPPTLDGRSIGRSPA
jgi:hypothetical protein